MTLTQSPKAGSACHHRLQPGPETSAHQSAVSARTGTRLEPRWLRSLYKISTGLQRTLLLYRTSLYTEMECQENAPEGFLLHTLRRIISFFGGRESKKRDLDRCLEVMWWTNIAWVLQTLLCRDGWVSEGNLLTHQPFHTSLLILATGRKLSDLHVKTRKSCTIVILQWDFSL